MTFNWSSAWSSQTVDAQHPRIWIPIASLPHTSHVFFISAIIFHYDPWPKIYVKSSNQPGNELPDGAGSYKTLLTIINRSTSLPGMDVEVLSLYNASLVWNRLELTLFNEITWFNRLKYFESYTGRQGHGIIFIVMANHICHAGQGSCICTMILDLLSGTLQVDGLQPSTPWMAWSSGINSPTWPHRVPCGRIPGWPQALHVKNCIF